MRVVLMTRCNFDELVQVPYIPELLIFCRRIRREENIALTGGLS